jgi:hypothetical protein
LYTGRVPYHPAQPLARRPVTVPPRQRVIAGNIAPITLYLEYPASTALSYRGMSPESRSMCRASHSTSGTIKDPYTKMGRSQSVIHMGSFLCAVSGTSCVLQFVFKILNHCPCALAFKVNLKN